MNFSIIDFFSKCEIRKIANSVTFTEEILNGKLYFLCRVNAKYIGNKYRLSLIYSPVSLYQTCYTADT